MYCLGLIIEVYWIAFLGKRFVYGTRLGRDLYTKKTERRISVEQCKVCIIAVVAGSLWEYAHVKRKEKRNINHKISLIMQITKRMIYKANKKIYSRRLCLLANNSRLSTASFAYIILLIASIITYILHI